MVYCTRQRALCAAYDSCICHWCQLEYEWFIVPVSAPLVQPKIAVYIIGVNVNTNGLLYPSARPLCSLR